VIEKKGDKISLNEMIDTAQSAVRFRRISQLGGMLGAAQDAEWHFVLSVFQNLSEPFRSKRLKMPSGYCRCGLQLGKF
jgi:hypothetical protein